MSGHADSTRAIFFALGANFAITVAKGVAAFLSGSGAMLAETVHSFADCGNQALLLLGMRQAKRPSSPDHPLGYGKAVYFWSFLVAVMLFTLGGMFSLYEGIHKLSHPEPLEQWWWAVGVLAFSIVAESISMRACLVEVNKARGQQPLGQWFRESRQAELIVIFGEDLAALSGLTLALIAVVLAVVTGNPLWDALGTVAIGLLLIVLMPFVGRLYTAVDGGGPASIVLRAVVSVILLLPPTMLMGATLPAISRYVKATPEGVAWLGFFYGGNIFGAVIGCLSAGFYLLRVYDLTTASLVAVALNAIVAGASFLLSKHAPYAAPHGSGESAITIKDSWKPRDDVTIEGGVRWVYWPPWYSTTNNISNFDPRFYDSANQAVMSPSTDDSISPRL